MMGITDVEDPSGITTYVQEIFYPEIYSRGGSFPGNFLHGEFFPVKVCLDSFFPLAMVVFSRNFHVAEAKRKLEFSVRNLFPIEGIFSRDRKDTKFFPVILKFKRHT